MNLQISMDENQDIMPIQVTILNKDLLCKDM